MPTILIVDDDQKIRHQLRAALEASDFDVEEARSGSELRAALAAQVPSLITLDLILGEEDGVALAREIIGTHDVPLIMVTGVLTKTSERIAGLDLGADDYLAKPFELSEYVARVRAVLRRYENRPLQQPGLAEKAPEPSAYRFDIWTLDLKRHELRLTGGEKRDVTAGEYSLLELFLRRPGRVLARQEIKEQLSGEELSADDRSIDVQVSRLRRKIEISGSGKQLIKTVRRAGYFLDCPVEPDFT